MAASGGEDERSGLGQFVKSQTKYGTATKTALKNETFYKYPVSDGETIQGIALKYGVTVEQIKRANNIWTNDSLLLRKFLLLPIESTDAEQRNDNSQPTYSVTDTKAQFKDLEIVTRQDMQVFNKPSRSQSMDSSALCNVQQSSHNGKAGNSIAKSDNFKDFLSKMDSNLDQIKNRAQELDKTSQFSEDSQNPLNFLPKKSTKLSKRNTHRHSIEMDNFDLAAEPELGFRSRTSPRPHQSSDDKQGLVQNDMFNL